MSRVLHQKENKTLREKIKLLEKENKLLVQRNELDREILKTETAAHEETRKLLQSSEDFAKLLLQVYEHQVNLTEELQPCFDEIDIRQNDSGKSEAISENC